MDARSPGMATVRAGDDALRHERRVNPYNVFSCAAHRARVDDRAGRSRGEAPRGGRRWLRRRDRRRPFGACPCRRNRKMNLLLHRRYRRGLRDAGDRAPGDDVPAPGVPGERAARVRFAGGRGGVASPAKLDDGKGRGGETLLEIEGTDVDDRVPGAGSSRDDGVCGVLGVVCGDGNVAGRVCVCASCVGAETSAADVASPRGTHPRMKRSRSCRTMR